MAMTMTTEQKKQAMDALTRILTSQPRENCGVSDEQLRDFLKHPDKQKQEHRQVFLHAMASPQAARRLRQMQEELSSAAVAAATTTAAAAAVAAAVTALEEICCVIKILVITPDPLRLGQADTTGQVQICGQEAQQIQESAQVCLRSKPIVGNSGQFSIEPLLEARAHGKFWLLLSIYDSAGSDISHEFHIQSGEGLGILVQPGDNTVYLQRGSTVYPVEFQVELREREDW